MAILTEKKETGSYVKISVFMMLLIILTGAASLDSSAEKYARENSIPFAYLDEMDIIALPEDCTVIESGAFAGLGDSEVMRVIYLSEKVTKNADDAFDGSKVYFLCPGGTYAENWALEHNIPLL